MYRRWRRCLFFGRRWISASKLNIDVNFHAVKVVANIGIKWKLILHLYYMYIISIKVIKGCLCVCLYRKILLNDKLNWKVRVDPYSSFLTALRGLFLGVETEIKYKLLNFKNIFYLSMLTQQTEQQEPPLSQDELSWAKNM